MATIGEPEPKAEPEAEAEPEPEPEPEPEADARHGDRGMMMMMKFQHLSPLVGPTGHIIMQCNQMPLLDQTEGASINRRLYLERPPL